MRRRSESVSVSPCINFFATGAYLRGLVLISEVGQEMHGDAIPSKKNNILLSVVSYMMLVQD
jgi:hypothetical protein